MVVVAVSVVFRWRFVLFVFFGSFVFLVLFVACCFVWVVLGGLWPCVGKL